MLHIRLLAALLFILTSSLLSAAPIQACVSFSILGDLVQTVGGERINVSTLVGKDQDAHIFQPAPSDVQKLAGCKLFFANGLGFEGWQKRLLKASRFAGKVIIVTQGIKPLEMTHAGHGHHADPHTWQDPIRVKIMIDNIATALTIADPATGDHYRSRAANYNKEIDLLVEWAKAEVARIPAAKRAVLTSHDAFGYLGQRFGIRMLAPQGVSTEAEASAKDVARLIQQMKQSGIRALFMENISNPKLIEQIARETGTKPGHKLYSDALSANDEASTYLKMYRYNISALVAGMQTNR